MDTMISWMIILRTRFVARMMTMIRLMAATLPQRFTELTIVRNCGYSDGSETMASEKALLAEPLFASTTLYHQDLSAGSGTLKGSNAQVRMFWIIWLDS